MNINRRKFFKATSLTTANLAIFSLSGYPNNITGFISKDTDENKKVSMSTIAAVRQKFLVPSSDTGSSCYWWWFNGLVSKEGITRDLEEFQKKGMGGVLLVNSASGLGGAAIPSGVKLFSKEWCELYKHAIKEAARLKIEVGVNLTSGWCMGGPWIKPENSGRWFLQSKITLQGPQEFSGKLPLPGNRDGYDNVFNPPGFREYIDLPLEKLDYRDTAVVAIPEIPGAIIADEERKTYFSAKTNRKDASNFTKAKDVQEPAIHPWQNMPGDSPVPVQQVIDLTSKLKEDGRLEWSVPPGKWIVIRTGHRMTGSRPMIAQPEADGLSVDWLASKPVDIQFENFGKLLLTIAATVKGSTLKYFCDDSFEDGFPNWTEKILEKFQYYRGYDAKPYLPVLAGYMIGSAEISDRFLHDYRKTVADCMADGHYKRFADLCHENGLMVQNESAGPSRSGTMCMDGLKNLGRSDYPQGEFWLGLRYDEEGGEDHNLPYGQSRLENGQNKVTKMTASASHIYGKKTASAEAFTQYRHWCDSPGSLKPALDRAFCEGINRIVIHSTTSTRPEDGLPGYEYGAGTHFNPNVTWWDKSKPFLSYVARAQYLLRKGKFVADVLYYNGDWAPNLVEPKHTDASLGKGYDYDVCNEEVLLTRLSVKNKRLFLPDGMSYRILVLPNTNRMPLPVMKKIKELVKAGATVSGQRPLIDPGLKNFPGNDDELKAISSEVWGPCNGKEVKLHHYGKGRIFDGLPLKEIFIQDQTPPDFEHSGNEDVFIDFIHRTLENDLEVYFIANRNKRMEKIDCTFRITGSQPEIWDPVSGKIINDITYTEADGRTTLPLEFFPHQSFFIVFTKTGKQIAHLTKQKNNFPSTKLLQEITGSWQVKFDPKWGGPAEIEFPKLEDWTKSPKDEIRYYSGKATYFKKFDLSPSVLPGSRLFLDLGLVKNIAQVKLNGVDLGIIWTEPWRVEISSIIKNADNLLEIEVVNLWPNRLIGDAGLSKELRLTRTNIAFKSGDPLLPSGLLGPVTLHEIFNV
jgi:hypothetical protein